MVTPTPSPFLGLPLDLVAIFNNLVSSVIWLIAGAVGLYCLQKLFRPWRTRRSHALATKRAHAIRQELQRIEDLKRDVPRLYLGLFQRAFSFFFWLTMSTLLAFLTLLGLTAPPRELYDLFLVSVGAFSCLGANLICFKEASTGFQDAGLLNNRRKEDLTAELEKLREAVPELFPAEVPASHAP